MRSKKRYENFVRGDKTIEFDKGHCISLAEDACYKSFFFNRTFQTIEKM